MSETKKVAEWVKLLEQDDRLRQEGAAAMYDRIVLLKKVYDDPEYREAKGDDWIRELNRRVSEYYFDFSQLLLILKFYPDKQMWVAGNLRTMYQEAGRKFRQSEQERKLFEGEEDTGKTKKKSKTAVGGLSRRQKYDELLKQHEDLKREFAEYKAAMEARYSELRREHNQLLKKLSKKLVDA